MYTINYKTSEYLQCMKFTIIQNCINEYFVLILSLYKSNKNFRKILLNDFLNSLKPKLNLAHFKYVAQCILHNNVHESTSKENDILLSLYTFV